MRLTMSKYQTTRRLLKGIPLQHPGIADTNRQGFPPRGGFARLELLFCLALVVLLLQMFPSLWGALALAIDVRNWSSGTWMSVNLGIIVLLFGIQFGPVLHTKWREHRTRQAIERDKQDKQRTVNEQRETFERLREARKRQVV